jgi:hypothetical protein
MHKHFVTLFDKNFLAHGLALNESLMRSVDSYTLWVICMDEITFNVISSMKLQSLRLIKLEDVETKSLLGVKNDRTTAEYCWTITPFAPDFVFDVDPSIKEITYIDADMYVLNKKINNIFAEFEKSKKSVLITKHAYSPEYDLSEISGIFCVQFMIFTRDSSSYIRKNWQEQCIEWCFNRYENDKFGDQKYLDEWPEKYSDDVHILEQESLMLGPWNSTRFPYSDGAAWHFHGLRINKDENTSQLSLSTNSAYQIPAPTIKNIYCLYISKLNIAIQQLANVGYLL